MTYVEEVQARAKRRRSPWNFLLLPVVLVSLAGLSVGLILLLQLLHHARYPTQNLVDSSGAGGVLTALGAFFAAITPALLFGNGLVWLLKPARQVLDREANAFPGTDFLHAQRQLIRFGLIIVPISLAFAVLGAFLPW